VAGSSLHSETASDLKVHEEVQLHLDVSVRSLKADSYAKWANCVIDGDGAGAAMVRKTLTFPIFLTRELHRMRAFLKANTIGQSRAGLVASSQAARLRAEGLEPDSAFHAGYPWEHWYLASPDDVRSSFQLEVFATEFEIQGLELDWIGLCWGGDYVWLPSAGKWLHRAFRATNSKWSEIKSLERRIYRRNAYRVLLTRARQGIVLYVPRGDDGDRLGVWSSSMLPRSFYWLAVRPRSESVTESGSRERKLELGSRSTEVHEWICGVRVEEVQAVG
jgi:hypothetical protein